MLLDEESLAHTFIDNDDPLYLIEDSPLLIRQKEKESNARSYPRRIPLALSKGNGIYVEDVEGRRFIDCLAGAGALVLGHNHPVVVEAMRRVLDDGLPLLTLDLTTPVKDKFIQDLFAILPASFRQQAKIQFCGPSGTDAVEAALKLVRTATGRSTILSFQGAYHGMSQGALSLMGNLGPKKPLAALLSNNVQFMPYPNHYRCPFGLGGEQGVNANLHYLESLFANPESGVSLPAGVIVEVIQGEGGVIPADIHWLKGLRRITSTYGVPLIVDEIQSGFARTGTMFAFEKADIIPDAIVLSKAIGGSLPLAVLVYNEQWDKWQPGAHAGTFRGNQMAMAAGSAVMEYLVRENMTTHATRMGMRLFQHFRALQIRYPQVGDVRGRGLMLGVEIVDPAGNPDACGNPPPSGSLAAVIQRECLVRGLIVEVGGRFGSVVRFLPPLIITDSEVDKIASIFSKAVEAAIKY
ncbi:aspartate aminotransferase family protein [Cellvibrio japonicus]|uniref:Diaminobutyrate-2-oxoglutarate transaminase n=1 Tax=Cellvibrio japonicus (strain Ueda107) TaxID=498211 RepID=B3PGM4_CELJU|nr:aspartate aminotransferase family protein [Cellvibrio japonicus]ACE85993.1 diaminobutyrate-2-oxoglutarate transaminase [Cellvibrio japonicus Ueda107]QEI12372.1 aspartate aminotransferase family protein [Cellvibrio japonicus]QEI15945.1 aspartate aminotransferase family protein [Cellvibrio japonicus]QEI19524.1 aspartate aminotransferase family protein [Cellvibrio japonicus]